MVVPLQGLRNRAQDVVVSALGAADDDDHRGFGPAQAAQRTLSIHSILTRRREAYYWAVVFATFALGTALGDFTASVLGLGYLASGIMLVFPS